MPRLAGAPSKVYVDKYDFSGRTNSLTFTIDNNLPPVTCFADDGDYHVEGKHNSKMSFGGFFCAEDEGYDITMWNILGDGANHLIGAYPGTAAPHGSIGYEILGKCAAQPRPVDVAGAILLNVDWQGNGPIVRGTVLANGAVTATGAITNSNKNLGATGATDTFVAILRVLSVTGAGSITVEIEESQDDGSGDAYAQLIAFTAATGTTSERKSVTQATEAWKRVNVTAFSGFTSVTLMVVVGLEKESP